jgi:hypothetical protein
MAVENNALSAELSKEWYTSRELVDKENVVFMR